MLTLQTDMDKADVFNTFFACFNTGDRPRSLRTLSWSTMTVRTINSKSALKLWGICYSNWILAKLWGLMESQNLSWQVLNDFGNPERSQLTGSWRLLSLF